MSREHLGIALALNVPVMVVITKIDICPPNILEQTVTQLTKILKSPGAKKIPIFIKNREQCINTAVRILCTIPKSRKLSNKSFRPSLSALAFAQSSRSLMSLVNVSTWSAFSSISSHTTATIIRRLPSNSTSMTLSQSHS